MTARKHRIAAGILFLVVLLVVAGTVRTGLSVDWDFTAAVDFGRRAAPFAVVASVFWVLGVLAAAAAMWQLRLATRRESSRS